MSSQRLRTPAGGAQRDEPHGGPHSPLLLDVGCAALAGALALLVATLVLQLWDAKLHVPLTLLNGDTTDSLMIVKMLAGGSWFHNGLIGAPTGTSFRDYPFFWDLGQVLGIKSLSLVFSDPAAIFNVSYVLSYPVIAINAYVALRWIGARRRAAVLAALLFSALPFHFLRGQVQLYISQYWAVPFSCALIFKLAVGQPLLARRPNDERRLLGWLSGTTLATLAAAAVSGVQFGYYAIFTLLLVALVALIMLLATRSRRSLIDPIVVLAVTGAGFVLMLMPTLVYRVAHGTDHLVANRVPQEAELYGLKLTQLLLPIAGHRISAFSHKATEYAASAPPLGEGQSTPALGVLLSIAFIGSLLVLVAGAFRGRPLSRQGAALRASGLCALLCFLLGTIGGGSSLFAYLISPQLRGWDRISVFLAFFAAISLAVMVGWALFEGRRGGPGGMVLLVLLCVIGVLDQTSPNFSPDYPTYLASWRSDDQFVKQIEHQVPAHAMMLELPYVAFPESPPMAQATDFDLFRGELHSSTLRWSYGAMKGRSSDWAATSVQGQPLPSVVPAAAAAGFAGVFVDRFYYADGGAATLNELSHVTGQPLQGSPDGRLAFVPLAQVSQRLRSTCSASAIQSEGDALVHPTVPVWGQGFYSEETDGRDTWHWAGPAATLGFTVPSGRSRSVDANFQLRGSTGAPISVTVQAGSQPPRIVQVAGGRSAAVHLVLPAGAAPPEVRLSTSGPTDGPADSRDLRMRVVNLHLAAGTGCAAGI